MVKNKQIAIFKGKKIRRVWDKKREKWYFSVVDIVAILTSQTDFQRSRNYWKVL
ncbi:MAG: Inositol-5-monophosphate dehydrogenase, partial [Candidatus Woesebacteria bacterium GW2011_GWA2_44_33]